MQNIFAFIKIYSVYAFVIFLLAAGFLFGITGTAYGASSEILTRQWDLSASRNSTEKYQLVDPNVLRGKSRLRLTYDLKGTCLFDGDASAIIFDQPINRTWQYISLSRYGKNCHKGEQTVDIPLSQFKGLDLTRPVGTFHVRI